MQPDGNEENKNHGEVQLVLNCLLSADLCWLRSMDSDGSVVKEAIRSSPVQAPLPLICTEQGL